MNVNLPPVRVLHYYGFAYRLVVESLEGPMFVEGSCVSSSMKHLAPTEERDTPRMAVLWDDL